MASKTTRSRARAFFVVLSASLTIAATTLGGRMSQDPVRKRFSHVEHVSRTWQNLQQPEVYRDCRGCHRFGPDITISQPQAVCDDCHQGVGKLEREVAPGFVDDLSGDATRTRPAFRHHSHGMLECRQCHYDEIDLLAHMPVRSGPALCAECHQNIVTAADVAAFRWFGGLEDEGLARAVGLDEVFVPPADAEATAAYTKRLDAVFAGPDGGINRTPLPSGGDFDHADHIATVAGAEGIACSVCHVDIRGAGAGEVGTGQIPTEGCGQCHVQNATGTAATAAPAIAESEPRPLWSLGTFAHADHYAFLAPGGSRKPDVAGDEAYAAIDRGDETCATCHRYAPEVPSLSVRDFPFDGASSKHTYAQCIGCHDRAGWQTGEPVGGSGGVTPVLHGSNGGDGWQACSACHVLGEADMAGRRPRVSVQRHRDAVFVFEGQTHPHITTTGSERARRDGAALEQECSDCHRAQVPALPTRLIERPFRHDTHLGEVVSAESCTGCHPSAARASSSQELADAASFQTYSLDGCKQCHWGGDLTVRAGGGAADAGQAAQAPAATEVVAFPHQAHVAAGQACSECHAPAADGGEMTTKAEALACNQCHKHEAAAAGTRPPELLVGAEVASCARCHHEEKNGQQVASVPPARGSQAAQNDWRYAQRQRRFAGFVQSQFHPAGSTCTDCHRAVDRRGRFAPVVVPTNTDHVFATHRLSVHADLTQGGFGRSEPADCLRCHVKPVGEWAAAVDVARDEPVGRRALRKQPQSPATRAEFGNRFRGFPGTEAADG